MTARIEAPDALSPGLRAVVEEMVSSCAARDAGPARVHWSLVERAGRGLVHRLAVVDGALAGYGAAYRFAPEEAEAVMVVAPEHRRCGIARALMDALTPALRSWTPETDAGWLGFVPDALDGHEPGARTVGQHLGGVRERVDYAMVCRAVRENGRVDVDACSLRVADIDDFDRLAQLDAESFRSSATLVRARLGEHLDGVRRRAYLARVGDEVVGKIHLRDDGDRVLVHDLCIRPRYRRRGLGASMVAAATARALDRRPVAALEVEAANVAAAATYAAVGYEVAASWSVYRFNPAHRAARE